MFIHADSARFLLKYGIIFYKDRYFFLPFSNTPFPNDLENRS